MKGGFALYSKDESIYAFPVGYEYPDKRFVGFDSKGQVFLIKRMSDEQKEWLKTNDPKKFEKTKNLIFAGDYYAGSMYWDEAIRPTGKPYTQLPGGGGCYKATRNINDIPTLLRNPTVVGVLDRFFLKGEAELRRFVQQVLTEEYDIVSYTAVAIEDGGEMRKIDKTIERLQLKIPEDFKRPTYKDGSPDYHMTVKIGRLPYNIAKEDINKEVTLNIDSYGQSSDAVALGVSGDYFSDNQFQHITIAFKELPASSKLIEKWIRMDKPIQVAGMLRQFNVDKEIVNDLAVI